MDEVRDCRGGGGAAVVVGFGSGCVSGLPKTHCSMRLSTVPVVATGGPYEVAARIGDGGGAGASAAYAHNVGGGSPSRHRGRLSAERAGAQVPCGGKRKGWVGRCRSGPPRRRNGRGVCGAVRVSAGPATATPALPGGTTGIVPSTFSATAPPLEQRSTVPILVRDIRSAFRGENRVYECVYEYGKCGIVLAASYSYTYSYTPISSGLSWDRACATHGFCRRPVED